MAIKNYVVNNKKKSATIFAAALFLILAIFGIYWFTSTKAGVYRKDGDQLVQVNQINVLEIVAEDGQQVLGYTVKGQEPITKEAIEAYSGEEDIIEDTTDFLNATGYQVEKHVKDGKYSYTVTASNLNTTFNENVLGDSMADGEITVKAVQASDLTTTDIKWADLVYINSNDYNSNLLYYYDKFMNGGAMEIAKGDCGPSFTGQIIKNEVRKAIICKKFTLAAGDEIKADLLTEEDIKILELDELEGIDASFSDNVSVYLDDIKAYFAGLEMDSLNGSNDDETLTNIQNAMIDAYNSIQTTSLDKINDAIENREDGTTIDESVEQKEAFLAELQKLTAGKYNELNADKYIEQFNNAYTTLDLTSVEQVVEDINNSVGNEMLDELSIDKVNINTEIQQDPEKQFTSEEIDNLVEKFKKLNASNVYENLLTSYIEAFIDPSFTYEDASYDEINGLIDSVNSEAYDAALTRLADSVTSEEALDVFDATGKTDMALLTSYKSDITEYKEENYDYYVRELKSLIEAGNQADFFKSTVQDDQGNDVLAIDYTKINFFLSEVNEGADNDKIEEVISCDMLWRYAYDLYLAAMNEEVGLMYNTDLLTEPSRMIGDYSKDLSNVSTLDDAYDYDNTNNVYKMLLILRQIRYEFYNDNIAAKVSSEGVYYPDGADANGNFQGTGITSWNKDTFNDVTNPSPALAADGTDYAKYHEPAVVGQTYGDDGTVGLSTDYVYKKIYSFSGDQFFGGAKFINDETDYSDVAYVLTGNATYTDKASASFIVDTRGAIDQSGNNNSMECKDTLYAHFWSSTGSSSYNVDFTSLTKVSDYHFKVVVPEGCDCVIFTKNAYWNDGKYQTRTIKIPDDYNGKTYSIYSGFDWDTNYDVLDDNYFVIDVAGYPGIGYKYSDSRNGYNPLYASYYDSYQNQNWNINVDNMYRVNQSDSSSRKYVVHVVSGMKYIKITNNDWNPWTNYLQTGYIDISGLTGSNICGQTYKLSTNNSLSLETDYTASFSSYNITINNFLKDDEVEFVGNMDMTVTGENLSSVTYSENNGTAKKVTLGTPFNLGKDMADGESREISITYTATDGTTKTVTTTITKCAIQKALNYLSKNTATDTTALGEDPSLSSTVNLQIANKTKGEIIRYLLGVTINEGYYPIRVLEIEPSPSTNIFDSYEGALNITNYLGLDAASDGMTKDNYKEYVQVSAMSVKEFDTRNDPLTTTYDIVYIGDDSGYMTLTSQGRTFYNDTSMTGLLYTGIGDQYSISQDHSGTIASDYVAVNDYSSWSDAHKKEYDYWLDYYTDGFRGYSSDSAWTLSGLASDSLNKNGSTYYKLKNSYVSTRLMGNDITLRKKKELLEYLQAGFPVLMADKIFDCDSSEYVSHDQSSDSTKWRYVDVNSKMYNFVVEAKKLGYDASTGTFTGYLYNSDGSLNTDASGNPQNAFRDGKVYPSVVKLSNAATGRNPENLQGSDKINGGLSYAYKRTARVQFEFVSGPTEYDSSVTNMVGTTIKSGTAEHKTFNIVVKVKSKITQKDLEAKYTCTMDMDNSGVGKFNESDTLNLDTNVEYVVSDEGYVTEIHASGNWPDTIEGFVPWRFEISSNANPNLKYSYKAYSAFATDIPRDVYVLWVRTEHDSNINTNLDFTKGIDSNVSNIQDYNIHVISMNYTQFKQMYSYTYGASSNLDPYTGNSTAYKNIVSPNFEYTKDTSLLKVNTVSQYMKNYNISTTKNSDNVSIDSNGRVTKDGAAIADDKEFDLLVLGFSDSYVGEDINSIPALKNIEYFVNAGHSLLYSHDSSSYESFLNYTNSGTDSTIKYTDNWEWGCYTTQFMRAMIGQDKYGIMLSGNEQTDATNASKMYLDTSDPTDFRGVTELTVFKYGTKHSNIYATKKHSTTQTNFSNWCHTKLVMRTNEGMITDYPFILPEEMTVALTHEQYALLNLEDEDTTVWYTLDDDGVQNVSNDPRYYTYTKGDGANNYYIYTTGLITYTGAGHSSIGSDTKEMNLFINTVIAAIKAGNYPPDVTIKNGYTKSDDAATKYINFYTNSDGVVVDFKATDIDYKQGIKAFSDCKIYADINKNGSYDDGTDYLLNDPSATYEDVNNDGTYTAGVDTLTASACGSKLFAADGTTQVNFTGANLLNKGTFEFFISSNVINEIVAKAGVDTIDQCNILIEVSDTGYKKAKKESDKVPSTSSALLVIMPKEPAQLFNLN